MMSREEDRVAADTALSQSTEEREFQEVLAKIAKLEAGGGTENHTPVGSSSRSVQLPAVHNAGLRESNASGIMTEEQELQIALEQIQAAEAREAALAASRTVD